MEDVFQAFQAAAEEIAERDGLPEEQEPPRTPENSDSDNPSSNDSNDCAAGNATEEEPFAFDDDDLDLTVEGDTPVAKILDWSKPERPNIKSKVKYNRTNKSQKALIAVIEDNQAAANHNGNVASAMYIKACNLAKLP